MCLIWGSLLPLILGGILVLPFLFTVKASLMEKGLSELSSINSSLAAPTANLRKGGLK